MALFRAKGSSASNGNNGKVLYKIPWGLLGVGVAIFLRLWNHGFSWGAELSDIYSLFSIMLGLQIESLKQSEKAIRFAHAGQEVEESGGMRPYLIEILDRLTDVEAQSRSTVGFQDPFVNRAENLIKELSSELHDLARETMDLDRHQFSVITDVLGQARRSIKAVAVCDTKHKIDWWTTSQEGRLYWGENKKFLQRNRGAKIERVFVYPSELSPVEQDRLINICRDQENLHCEVYVLECKDKRAVPRFDFAVFDDAFAFEQKFTGMGEVHSLKCARNDQEVSEYIHKFNDDKADATKFKESDLLISYQERMSNQKKSSQ